MVVVMVVVVSVRCGRAAGVHPAVDSAAHPHSGTLFAGSGSRLADVIITRVPVLVLLFNSGASGASGGVIGSSGRIRKSFLMTAAAGRQPQGCCDAISDVDAADPQPRGRRWIAGPVASDGRGRRRSSRSFGSRSRVDGGCAVLRRRAVEASGARSAGSRCRRHRRSAASGGILSAGSPDAGQTGQSGQPPRQRRTASGCTFTTHFRLLFRIDRKRIARVAQVDQRQRLHGGRRDSGTHPDVDVEVVLALVDALHLVGDDSGSGVGGGVADDGYPLVVEDLAALGQRSVAP